MTFLPIVARELRVASRRSKTYSSRLRVGIGASALAAYLIAITQNVLGGGRAAGLMFSGFLAYICGFYCIALAIRNSADCISQEKREGTLGLLFLTDLKGYDVILGKLLSSGLNSFYGLLAAFPALGMGVLLGGVSGRQFWAMTLALVNFFFFAHALGLLVSTLSLQQRHAMGNTLALLIVWTAGFPLVGLWLEHYHHLVAGRLFSFLSPGYAVAMVPAFGARSSYFWPSFCLVHLNAWIFLAISCWYVPRSWQDKASRRRLAWRERLRQWSYGSARARAAFRRRLVDVNPFFWLTSRTRRGPFWVWAVLCVQALLWGWIYRKVLSGPGKLRPDEAVPLCVATVIVSHSILKWWIASEAPRHIEEQRHSGALEFLLSCTPLSVEEILGGQWLALRRQFFWPLVVVLAADCALLVASGAWKLPSPGWTVGDSVRYVGWAVAAMIMLMADGIAMGWVGMWQAISQKRRRGASGATVMRILVLPIVLALTFSLAVVDFVARLKSKPADWFPLFLILWFVLGIGFDLFFALYSRRRVRSEFRLRAAMTADEPLGLLGRLGRALGQLWAAKS